MDEDIKFLIDEVNRVLNKNYNLISFNEMSSNDLIQLLCESLSVVQKENKIIFDQQSIDETVIKIPEILNNIGYRNSFEVDRHMMDLRKGDKNIIHPILIWIYRNLEKVKLRAYLAEYLVRINIPSNYLEYPEIQNAYKNYLSLIDNFKKTHLEYGKTKEDSAIVKSTEENIQVLTKNIAFLKARATEAKEKIGKVSNADEKLPSIELLWEEYQKEQQMTNQMEEQQNLIEKLDTEYAKLQQNLQSLHNAKFNSNNPLQQIKDDLNQNSEMLTKLTKQLSNSQKKIERLRQVVNMQGITEDELNDWRERIEELQHELQDLEGKKRQQIDPLSDRLAPYGKELAAINESQHKAMNTLNKTKMSYQFAERTLKEKQAAVDKLIGHEVKRGSELKEYIRSLREKNQLVEYYKEIISGMKAEHEIQLRTMEILGQKHPDVKDIFEKRRKGTGPKVAKNITPDTNSVSEIVKLCRQTRLNVDSSKAQLSAYMQEVQPLREMIRNENKKLQQLQKNFETNVGGLKQEQERANRELEALKAELRRKEEQWKILQREIQTKDETLQKIQEETGDGENVNVSETQKTILERKLREAEEETSNLLKRKKHLEDTQGEREKVSKSWMTAKKLLEIKMRNKEANNKKVQKIGRVEILTL